MIVVLSRDASQGVIEDVCARARGLGWKAEVSRGSEQIAIAMAGSGDAEALRRALAGVPDADLLPILSGREYWRERMRRRFVAWLASALGLLVAIGIALPILGYLAPPSTAEVRSDEMPVTRSSALVEGAARVLRFRGRPVLLVHESAERYFALSANCTLESACLLEWNRERAQVVCPCHGCTFDRNGSVSMGPASVPLVRYVVEKRGETLVLRSNL